MDESDVLSGLTADLVALKRYEAVLCKLFSSPGGQWQTLSALCRDEPGVIARLSLLGEEGQSVYVTWLDFPVSVYGAGYRTIIFYSDRLSWHNLALYHAAALGDGATPSSV